MNRTIEYHFEELPLFYFKDTGSLKAFRPSYMDGYVIAEGVAEVTVTRFDEDGCDWSISKIELKPWSIGAPERFDVPESHPIHALILRALDERCSAAIIDKIGEELEDDYLRVMRSYRAPAYGCGSFV